MKKALALVLALVMCLSLGMMAFAEDHDQDDAVVTGETTITSAGDANTQVDILVNSTNISVTVPLKYAVVADIKGGDCLEPTDYAILNNSAIDVKVANASAAPTADNDSWELVAAADTTGIPDGKNQIDMTLTADSAAWNLAETYNAGWIIDAATSAAEGELAIAIEAHSSMLNTTDDQINAFVITYTFEAA